jgi:hypothetical protein
MIGWYAIQDIVDYHNPWPEKSSKLASVKGWQRVLKAQFGHDSILVDLGGAVGVLFKQERVEKTWVGVDSNLYHLGDVTNR